MQHDMILSNHLNRTRIHILILIIRRIMDLITHSLQNMDIIHLKLDQKAAVMRHDQYFLHFVKSSVFSCPIAVVAPSATPSVLSGRNKIFTVASMILRSSTMLGWAMYIRSICSLS